MLKGLAAEPSPGPQVSDTHASLRRSHSHHLQPSPLPSPSYTDSRSLKWTECCILTASFCQFEPGPNTFPDGLAAFHRATGWNITAHNRMWATDNVYAKQNGGNFSWIVDKKVAVPIQQEFWNYLMTQGKQWGLYVYEQDWWERRCMLRQ